MANSQRVAVKGISTVQIHVVNHDGKRRSIKIKNVLYVPSINGNLLSVRKLVVNRFNVNFVPNEYCNIMYRDVQIATAVLQDNLYVLKEVNKVLLTIDGGHPKNCIHQWHKWCRHRDLEIVKRLSTDGYVKGADIVNCPINETCGTCQQGKIRVPFPKAIEKRSKEVMNLVHTDVCGPM